MHAYSYFQYLIGLIITVSVLYGILYFAKRFQKQRFASEIDVLDRLPVDHGVTLLIVKVREKEYLLGTGDKSIKVIDKL